LLTKRSLHGRVLEVCVDLDMAIRKDEPGGAKAAAQRRMTQQSLKFKAVRL